MLTRCSNCQTQFSLDDRQVGPDGAAIRCSVCGYVFRVEPPAGAETPPWQIRTIEDQLFTAPDLAALRDWIGEGRLHPDDRISRTGQNWVRLREMPEFSDAFSGFSGLPPLFVPIDAAAPESDEVGPPPEFSHDEVADDEIEQLSDDDADVVEIGAEPEPDAPTQRNPDAIDTVVARPMGRPVSAPIAIEPVPARPRSMLDVVTHRAAESSDVAATRVAAPNLEPRAEPPAAPAPGPTATVDPGLTRQLVEPRRRGPWPLAAGLSVLCVAALVMGVPQVRQRVMSMFGAGEDTSAKNAEPPELLAAREAIALADPTALTQAEVALRSRMKGATDQELARLQLAQVDVLTTRALSSAIWAFLDPASADKLHVDVQDDAERAVQLFAHPDLARLPTASVEEARARLRLVQGKEPELILRRYPADADAELALMVTGSPLWRSRTERVPDGLIAGLRQLESPSVLARVLLGIAYLRSGDEEAARKVVAEIQEDHAEHPVVDAFTDRLEAMAQGAREDAAVSALDPSQIAETEGAGDETGSAPHEESGADDEEPELVAEEPEQGGQKRADDEPSKDEDDGEAMGIDRMIDVGCTRVENGHVREGLDLLIKAHDRKPHDVDVLICMGEAHMRLGNYGTALRQFERALDRSPRIGSAVRGAARAARKSGAGDKALKYYERVLEIEPRNAEARAYVDEHATPSPGGENG